MFIQMLFSKEFLGSSDWNSLDIFVALLFTPFALCADIICLPLELISFVIYKIIRKKKE